MDVVVIYAFVFVAALLTVDTILRSIFRSRRTAHEINSRLRHLKQSGNQLKAYETLMSRRGIRRGVEDLMTGGLFNRIYSQSGLELNTAQKFGYVLLFFLAGWGIAAFLITKNVPLQIFIAAVVALVVSIVTVMYVRRHRIQVFTGQLPEAIDVVVRSLRAGHPLNAAVSLVAKEMVDPIGSEFGVLNDQLSFGEDLETAMLKVYDRVGAEELKLLTVTVTVQSSTGGNLAEILENLATMIRDRIMLKAKIRAISAEGRMTAVVMAIFPFGLFLMIRALVPTYFDTLIETGWAPTVVAVCLCIMAVGLFVLHRMVNFDF